MDFTFYIFVTLASGILLLAMWACSSHGVKQWGPDLTMELPAHLLQEVLFPPNTPKPMVEEEIVPSAPSDLSGDTLLKRISVPSTSKKKKPLIPPKPSAPPIHAEDNILLIPETKMSQRPLIAPKPKLNSAIRVLPPLQHHKLKSAPNSFTFEKLT